MPYQDRLKNAVRTFKDGLPDQKKLEAELLKSKQPLHYEPDSLENYYINERIEEKNRQGDA